MQYISWKLKQWPLLSDLLHKEEVKDTKTLYDLSIKLSKLAETFHIIVCIGISTPLKNTPLFLAKPSPLKSENSVSPSFIGSLSFLYWFLVNPPPPLKVWFFSETPKYWNFSFLTPSYLWKVTEFLVKISKFDFLVTTDFFCVKIATPLWKKSPIFPSNPPLKVEVLSSRPSFWKFVWRFISPAERGQGAHYAYGASKSCWYFSGLCY